MLGIAVAGPIFQLSPSKTLAGEINGVILGRMNVIEWVCGTIALLATIGLAVGQGFSTSRVLAIGGLVVALVLLWFYSSQMTGTMTELRQTIGDFDHPRADQSYVSAKAQFDMLHHRYTTLVGINMLIIAGEFVWGMLKLRS